MHSVMIVHLANAEIMGWKCLYMEFNGCRTILNLEPGLQVLITISLKYEIPKQYLVPLLFSNVIDTDHQNDCLFTNKGHFSSPLWVLIGVLAEFHE